MRMTSLLHGSSCFQYLGHGQKERWCSHEVAAQSTSFSNKRDIGGDNRVIEDAAIAVGALHLHPLLQ
jgi:hypothetical protein